MEQSTIDKLIEAASIFKHHDVRIEDGRFRGAAYSKPFQGGHTVAFSITTLDPDSRESYLHIPYVTVLDPQDGVVAEPHAYDSEVYRTALKDAISTATWVYDDWVAAEPPKQ